MVPAGSRWSLVPQQVCGTQVVAPGPAMLGADVFAPQHMDTPCSAIWDKLQSRDVHMGKTANLGAQKCRTNHNPPAPGAARPGISIPCLDQHSCLPPSDGWWCGLITKSNIQELPALPEALQRWMGETWEALPAPGACRAALG